MAFAHLHTHTEYSLLDGSNKIKEYVRRVKELGMESAAITDHGVMYGVIDFYKAAKDEGIKPVIGCEVYVAPESRFDKEAGKGEERYRHLILLAENNTGYLNLMKIVSIGFTEGFYHRPRVDFEILQKYHEGLICMSACLAGEVPRAIERGDYAAAREAALRYRDCFGEGNYFLEIQDHGIPAQRSVNAGLMRLSQETGIELVATNDVHYTLAEDADAHDVMLCIQTNKLITDTDRLRYEGGQYYVKSEEEMRNLFPYAPQAIENAAKIAERCNVEIEFGVRKLPEYNIEDGTEPFDYLLNLCNEGLKKRYPNAEGDRLQEIKSRIDFEINTIRQMGFVDYFLIVWDFINFARSKGIPVGPGRGSAAGSIVSYLIGITDIDPLEYNLLFERFLNPERVSMPDIDVDFCYDRRGEVIDYVVEKYGKECVTQIITFGTLAARAVIKQVGRAMGLPYDFRDEVAKLVPEELKITISSALAKEHSELKKRYEEDSRVKELLDTAMRLEGLPSHSSTHAAGVVISKSPMVEYVPLARGSDGSVVTQFTMTTIEELGLLKMDFLGLRTLTVISDCIKMVEESYGEKIDFDRIGYDDEAVYSLISSGRTEGVFQLESGGMRKFMKDLHPESFEDVIAGIALFRPGPMDFIPQYIKGKDNRKSITYDCPQLEPILSTTYGCIVYQEQVMEIVRSLAGYSLGRSDILRRAMSKKKSDVMKRERETFLFGDDDEGIAGCIANGIDEEVADHIYDEMLDFAKYAFNKSHAASYAVLSYQTAYLKYYYPKEFFACLLTSVMDKPSKVAEYISCLRHMGIGVAPPDINSSMGRFTVKDGKVIYGMYAVKNVGGPVVDAIIEERNLSGEFKTLQDFIERIVRIRKNGENGKSTQVVNKKAIECLIKSGAMDGLDGNRRQKIIAYPRLIDDASKKVKDGMSGQMTLFDIADSANREKMLMKLPDREEYPKSELLAFEKEVMGIYISGHPLEDYMDIIRNNVNATSDMFRGSNSSVDEYDDSGLYGEPEVGIRDGFNYIVGGIITDVNIRYTKRNQPMAILTLEDVQGSMEVIVFPTVYEKVKDYLVPDMKAFIKGRASLESDRDGKILCDSIIEFSKVPGRLWVKFPDEKTFEAHKKDLINFLLNKKGNDGVIVYIENTSTRKKLGFSVSCDEEMLCDLNAKYGENNVKFVKGKI